MNSKDTRAHIETDLPRSIVKCCGLVCAHSADRSELRVCKVPYAYLTELFLRSLVQDGARRRRATRGYTLSPRILIRRLKRQSNYSYV